ncbi:hypothetical protein HUW46_06705 [Amycolatopsis sp. CA-230715]|nr:hypothetical protein HUW46_06705 [Amycolatopsis sp. CA-230715]
MSKCRRFGVHRGTASSHSGKTHEWSRPRWSVRRSGGEQPCSGGPKDAPIEGSGRGCGRRLLWGGLCQDLGPRGGLPLSARVPEGGLRGGRRREFGPRTAFPPPAPPRGGPSGAPKVAFQGIQRPEGHRRGRRVVVVERARGGCAALSAPKATFGACAAQPAPREGRESGARVPEGGLRGPPPPIIVPRTRHHCDLRGTRFPESHFRGTRTPAAKRRAASASGHAPAGH